LRDTLTPLGGLAQAAQHGKQPGDRANPHFVFFSIPLNGIGHKNFYSVIYSPNETENSHRFSEIVH
jgi:hypothetical protein